MSFIVSIALTEVNYILDVFLPYKRSGQLGSIVAFLISLSDTEVEDDIDESFIFRKIHTLKQVRS